MKKERGITLIALVITVIIMLILAGVAINQITGKEGLLARSNHSVQKYEDASQTEAGKVSELINETYNSILTKAEIEANEENITTKKATLTGIGEDTRSGIAKYEFYVDGALYETVETEESSTNIELTFTKDSHVCYVRVYNKKDDYLDSTEITVNKHEHTDACYVTETKTGYYETYESSFENYGLRCSLCGATATFHEASSGDKHCSKTEKRLICGK